MQEGQFSRFELPKPSPINVVKDTVKLCNTYFERGYGMEMIPRAIKSNFYFWERAMEDMGAIKVWRGTTKGGEGLTDAEIKKRNFVLLSVFVYEVVRELDIVHTDPDQIINEAFNRIYPESRDQSFGEIEY